MEREFIIKMNQEQANYLQRLGMEVDSKVFLLDRLFSNHATDTDTILFESVPFKYYEQEYEKARAAWELAKQEFEQTYLMPEVKEKTGLENPHFNWLIDDYLSLEVHITLI